MARPTTYNEEILVKCEEYLTQTGDGYSVAQRPSIKDGKYVGDEDYREEKVNLPSIEGLAFYLGINKATIYDWRKVHEEFTNFLERLLAKQAKMLINKGLLGDYNPIIAKLILTKHGYSDKQETDVTSKGEKIVVIPSELALKNDTNQSPSTDSERHAQISGN